MFYVTCVSNVILGPLSARELGMATSTNTRSVASLLMGFFHYYSSFDYANRAICIVHGCCVARYLRTIGACHSAILLVSGNAYRQ